jgi:hypothetical protein
MQLLKYSDIWNERTAENAKDAENHRVLERFCVSPEFESSKFFLNAEERKGKRRVTQSFFDKFSSVADLMCENDCA